MLAVMYQTMQPIVKSKRTGIMRIFRKHSDCIAVSWYKLCNNVCLPSRFFVRKVVI